VTARIDHLPPRQIVERRSPEHGLLAAGVHRDVAADARGFRRSRVDGEDAAGGRRGLRDARRDHAGAGANRRAGAITSGSSISSTAPMFDQLLGVDHRRQRRQRNRTAGVTGAAAARNDGQPEFDAAAHQRRDLVLAVRVEDDEGVFDPPVGRVGDVRDAGQTVESDVVAARVPGQQLS
jgi:hypothetical protein